MKSHFLQSPAWEELEQLEGKTTFRLQDKNFQILAILETTPLGNYLFCPYGPTLKDPTTECLGSALAALTQLAREQHAFFARIEPTVPFPPAEFQSLGLVKSHDLDPAHTWVLDLSPSRDELLHNMKTSNRQRWNVHQKRGLAVRQTQNPADIAILTSLLSDVSKARHFNAQSKTHLQHQLQAGFATLYYVEYTDPDQPDSAPQTLAASLVYDTPTTRYYAHAAANSLHRELSAGAVLLVQMILDAKEKGQKHFDFWGITTSEDPNHPWYGFTKFKKSFGGRQVDYAGTWDLPLQKARYRVYRIIRKINRLKRRIWK